MVPPANINILYPSLAVNGHHERETYFDEIFAVFKLHPSQYIFRDGERYQSPSLSDIIRLMRPTNHSVQKPRSVLGVPFQMPILQE